MRRNEGSRFEDNFSMPHRQPLFKSQKLVLSLQHNFWPWLVIATGVVTSATELWPIQQACYDRNVRPLGRKQGSFVIRSHSRVVKINVTCLLKSSFKIWVILIGFNVEMARTKWQSVGILVERAFNSDYLVKIFNFLQLINQVSASQQKTIYATCGQSYKCFMIVNYNSRMVLTVIF